MSTGRRFPVLASHNAPLGCFYCKAPLETTAPPYDADYPDGAGRYRKVCSSCGCRTYYDLADSAPFADQPDTPTRDRQLATWRKGDPTI